MLGELSAKYESGNNPASVSDGIGDSGGISYGIYQFATCAGTPAAFVEWLKGREPPYDEYGRQLEAAGEPGTAGFSDKWIEIGTLDPEGFARLQHSYVRPVYFDPGVERLREWYGFDILRRSEALQNVLWSNCVQHGSYYGAEVFGNAASLYGQDLNSMADREIIYNVYEVKLTDPSWSSGAPALRPGLYHRWRSERNDALDMLARETEQA